MGAMIVLIMLLGYFMGMLVNYLADHLPVDRRLVRPHCLSCGGPRPWRHWSGLLAFVQSSACPYCENSRSRRSWLVEVLFLFGSVLLYTANPDLAVFLPAFIMLSIFGLIVVIDIEHRLILHMVTGPSALIMFLLGAMGWLNADTDLKETLIGGAVGFGSVYLLYLMGILFARAMSKARGEELSEVAFGFGDVTLSGVLGLALGWPRIMGAIFFGVMAAGTFSLFYILYKYIRKEYDMFMPIPYGPFLILGALVVFFGWVYPS